VPDVKPQPEQEERYPPIEPAIVPPGETP